LFATKAVANAPLPYRQHADLGSWSASHPDRVAKDIEEIYRLPKDEELALLFGAVGWRL
jgi:hypothetical protein